MPTGTTATKGVQVWTVNCAPECGFMLRDHDSKELVKLVQAHGKQTHNKNFTEQEVLGMAVASRF